MIFTDQFVYIHEPKTGGTFVTSMLFRLYDLKWTRLTHLRNALFGEVRAENKYGTLIHTSNKHGGCRQIPAKHRHKKILASIRNPFDQYVSQYEFGWWKRREFLRYFKSVPNFEKDYPRFPNVTFAEYVKLANAAFGGLNGNKSLPSPGLRTREFIDFYFKEPSKVWQPLQHDAEYIKGQKYRGDMFDVHFVRTNQLNQGLYEFLIEMGYGKDDVSFILTNEKILPRGRGRSADQKWQSYYTPELKRQVREAEQVLFTLFPEFDF